MKNPQFKNAMYSGLSKMLKALANPNRLEIIEMLSQGEKSVEGDESMISSILAFLIRKHNAVCFLGEASRLTGIPANVL